ncbi:MAG: hypothetical protein EOP85_00050 [Verrucomicrobiaceae bacterium]|nr:MAG: hypothetical protein EOP85_00050 [Verrucomicrobiaceae bacterium]
MSISTTYLLNVALHGAVLSILATGLLALLRRPGQRSFVAIAGLLAVGVLPWVTALRPEQRVSEPVAAVQQQPVSSSLPLWTVVTLPAPEEKFVVEYSAPVADASPFVLPDPLECVLLAWAAGTSAGLLLLAGALLKVVLWKRSLRPLDDEAWKNLTAFSSDVPARHLFLLSEAATSPCVAGFFRPRIVLPHFLLEKDAEHQLRWALGHELAHLRAGDSRWIIILSFIRCMNWWNPFVYLLVSRWADAREQLCDLHATGLSEDRSDYGKFLVTMARRITGRPPLAVTMAKRAQANRLKQRIVHLLESRADSMTPLGKGFVGTGTILIVVATVSVSILRIEADVPGEGFGNADAAEVIPEVNQATASDGTEGANEHELSRSPIDSRAPLPNDLAQADAGQKKRIYRQLKISPKLVLAGPNYGFTKKSRQNGEWFDIASLSSERQVQSILKGLKKDPANKLLTVPSMSALPEQHATIEIIREVLGSPEQIAARSVGAETPFVGIRVSMNSRFLDELNPSHATDPFPINSGVEIEQTVDYRYVPGVYQPIDEPGAIPPAGLDPDKIVSLKRKIRGRITPDMTFFLALGEVEPRKFLSIMTRVEVIDRNGQTLDPELTTERGWLVEEDIWNREEIHVGRTVRMSSERKLRAELKRRAEEGTLPLPENPGSLVLTGKLVDLPLEGERPRGEGLVMGLTPSTAETAETILTTPGAKIRELKTAEIPLAERATPWLEFPGLNVSAVVSRDRKLITIASHAVGNREGQFPNRWNDMPVGSTMNFGIRTTDAKIERRLLITIDAKP